MYILMAPPVVLSVRHLTTKFEIEGKIYKVVDNLSFDLKRGKTLALIGESGCGKSMTALSLLRLLPHPPALPSEGSVLYHGEDLLTLSPKQMQRIRGKKIAMIFQNPSSALNPVYTIGNQLEEVAIAHLHVSKDTARQMTLQALREVHFPNPEMNKHAYPHQLSGGMLQRAMIAMALICSPDILIADEPTTALDMTIQREILSLLSELQEKRGMSILLISHDMGIVSEIAHDGIVMYGGQQIEMGYVPTLFQHTAHPYTQALFASRLDPSIEKGKLPTIPGSVPRLTEFPKGCRFHPRCRYAMEICKEGPVPDFPFREDKIENTHKVKCWLYDEELEWKIDDPRD
ncbi:MAG: Oligopeptide transport ATP-binding protein OppD [Chlamydiae bacterium]|nr:Oligopeptide transport ATP-binding protein OppD [Chlamydiota bacterium]